MSDQASVPRSSDDEPDAAESAREAALAREVLRLQERHREGGIDEPAPGVADQDPEPDE